MVTDLNEVKGIAKSLLMAVDIEPKFSIVLNHPFTTSIFVPRTDENGGIVRGAEGKCGMENIYEDEEAYERWKNAWFKRIDCAKNVLEVITLIRDPWWLTFLKFAEPYINRRKFAELFAHGWVVSENPNMDANCTLEDYVRWFTSLKKEWLMEKEDLEVYEGLPQKLTVYRGVAVGRNPKGLSWTANLEKAEWFAHRFDRGDKVGYVQVAKITKDEVLAYFNTRNEDEIVVNTLAIEGEIEVYKEG